MKNRLTTSQLAKVLDVSPSRVRKIARDRKLTDQLSDKRYGMRWWVPSAIERLRPGPVGRPMGGGK